MGEWVLTLHKARTSTDVNVAGALVVGIPFIPLVFVPRGWVFERALMQERDKGEVTAELSAAFNDRAVAFARNYELVVIAAIIVLMVTRPF